MLHTAIRDIAIGPICITSGPAGGSARSHWHAQEWVLTAEGPLPERTLLVRLPNKFIVIRSAVKPHEEPGRRIERLNSEPNK